MKYIALILLFLLIFTSKAYAQLFPPCFPWCYTPNPFITPTVTPTLVISPSLTITPTETITPTPSSSPSGIIKGAYVGDGIENLTNVDAFESLTGKNLDVILVYQAWEGDWKNFRAQWITNAYANGSVPMITWEPWNYTMGVNQAKYRLSRIAAGNHDTFIRNYAIAAKATGKDFYLRPMHEMNGNWYPWAESANGNKSGDYIKAWKRIVDIFRQEGATNVKFVWCPNAVYTGSTSLTQLFPGDNYIDYLCMDGYNWGDTNGGWQSFTTVFQNTYNQLSALSNKPIIVGETASAEIGGPKPNWITDTYKVAITSMPKIIMINWFNANKEKDWRVNSTQASLNAFKEVIK